MTIFIKKPIFTARNKPMNDTLEKSINKINYMILASAAIIGLVCSAPSPAAAEDIIAQSAPTGDMATDMDIAQGITDETAPDSGQAAEQTFDQDSETLPPDDIPEPAAEKKNAHDADMPDDTAATRSDEAENLAQEAEDAANDSVMQPMADTAPSNAKTSENKRWWGRPY